MHSENGPAKNDEQDLSDHLQVKITRAESIAALFGGFLTSMAVHHAKRDVEKREMVDRVHELPGGKSLRNFGILHTREGFRARGREALAAVEQCDMLLVEDSDVPFFEECVQCAKSHGKKIVDIDVFNPQVQGPFEGGLTAGSLLIAGEQAYAEWKRMKGHVPMRALHTRRNILRACCGVGVAATCFHGFDLPFQNDNEGLQSFLTRGRTAAMLDESQRIVRQGEEKKHLLVTGNAHALIIEDYFSDPRVFAEDLEKFHTQFSLFGRGSEAVR